MTSWQGSSPPSSRRDSTRKLGYFIPSKRQYTATDLCGGKTSRTGVVKYSTLSRSGSQWRCRKSSPSTLVLGEVRDLIRVLFTSTMLEHSPRSLVDSLTRHNDAGAASGRDLDGGQGSGSYPLGNWRRLLRRVRSPSKRGIGPRSTLDIATTSSTRSRSKLRSCQQSRYSKGTHRTYGGHPIVRGAWGRRLTLIRPTSGVRSPSSTRSSRAKSSRPSKLVRRTRRLPLCLSGWTVLLITLSTDCSQAVAQQLRPRLAEFTSS